MASLDFPIEFARSQRTPSRNHSDIDQHSFVAILVEVGGGVVALISSTKSISLRFDWWPAGQERYSDSSGILRRIVISRMFDDPTKRTSNVRLSPGKIRYRCSRCSTIRSACKLWSNRSPYGRSNSSSFRSPRMSEGRVTNVVYESQRFREICVEFERFRDSAGDLRNLDRVREPVAEMIGITRRENLSLGFEAAKRS